ncbi:Uncharacterized protein Rs2_36703 [Raphanus sativus]|nr:Uncharacterized protein Rs2_36703 [Raphanus sativus]
MATAIKLSGTTLRSRGLNSLRHLPLAQVSKIQPNSRNGDGITPLHYGHPAALTRSNALNTSTFETSPPPFSAWSPFITIDKEQQPENVPPQQVPVSSSYEILDCPNVLNDSTAFPKTLL